MSSLIDKIRNFVEKTNERFVQLFERFETYSNKKIYITLFFLTFIICSPMVIAYEIENDPARVEHKDLDIFRDRAETIIEGDLLYRDTDYVTLSPPIINYLFVPAALLGGSALIWVCWFAMFVFFSSVILYQILISFVGKRYAIAGSVFFIVSPFSMYTTIRMMQDDAIIVSFLLLALLFIIRKSWYKAAAVFGLGTMTKVFPALCAPLAAIGPKLWKDRFKAMTIGLGIGILVTLPFLLYATDEFLQFLNFYLTGQQPASGEQLAERVSDVEQRGMSFWRFFGEHIYFVPSSFLHLIFVLALLMTWVSALMKKIEIIPAFVLCILWVFIFYSKVHYGYHLMAFSLLIPWALPHPKQLAGLGFAGFFLIAVHRIWRDTSMIQNPIVHLLLAFVMWLYWINWAGILIKNRKNNFPDMGSCNRSTLLIVSWFSVFCFGYYFWYTLRTILS